VKRPYGFAVLALAAAVSFAQTAPAPQQEQDDLAKALADAGGSPKDYLRAIEKQLQKYPNSPRKEEYERAAALAAIDAKDDGKIVEYGERVLARRPDDLQILAPVARALAADPSKDGAERALKYARRIENLVDGMRAQRPRDSNWQNQADMSLSRTLGYESQAAQHLGRAEEALTLARRAFETYPGADAAREIARSCQLLGKSSEAAAALADAFTVPDSRNTDADRARDRIRMGELYRQAHGSDAGLGELVLEAYDRNLALVRARELRMRADDPNAQRTDPMEFTLSAVDGGKLEMATLKGKVIILDVWATWCGPCRAQHPLYEQVKKQFAGNPDVVFLSIDTDEDHAAVRPFLDEVKWTGRVYFEDGLSRALKITSIPATFVIGRDGQVFSRMNGYVPNLFVESLAGKIRDALGNGTGPRP
jgi:thiol-disulfide isomerase/thioredoxin